MDVHLTAEMVSEALRLMEERDTFTRIRREEVATKIAEGLNSLQLGNGIDAETVFDRIDSELAETERFGRQ